MLYRLSALIVALLAAAQAFAQDGGVVTRGSAEIGRPDLNSVLIDQTSDKAVIEWGSFSIDVGHNVRFNQPSGGAITLNRVTGVEASSILGSLDANGQVFLLNPNGILFGSTAQVNVGSMMASTLSIGDDDFMNGEYRFVQPAGHELSYVVNRGSLRAGEGGYLVLAAPVIENAGSLVAPSGSVYLAAGREVVMELGDSGLINLSLGYLDEHGTVVMKPEAMSDAIRAVVNTDGWVEAGRVVEENGVVRLVGGEGIAVNRGTISVSGADAGTVHIRSTQGTFATALSVIEADGIGLDSDGGEIRLLSAGNTYYNGSATARGGDTGNGGLVEVSGDSQVAFYGTGDTSAPGGEAGLFYIDPDILNIVNSGGANNSEISDFSILASESPSATWSIDENTLKNLAGTSNVLLEAVTEIRIENLSSDKLEFKAESGYTVTFRTTSGTGGIYWHDSDTIKTSGGHLVIDSGYEIIGNGTSNTGPLETSGGNLTITGNGPILLGDLDTAGGDLTGTQAGATEDFEAGDVLTSGGDLSIDSGDDIRLGEVESSGGTVTLRALTHTNADLTVTSITSSAGSVTLFANDDIVSGDITSSVGSVTIEADDDVTLSNVTTSGTNVIITADLDSTGGGRVIQNSSSKWTTSGADVTVSGDRLDLTEGIDVGGGTITIQPRSASRDVRVGGSSSSSRLWIPEGWVNDGSMLKGDHLIIGSTGSDDLTIEDALQPSGFSFLTLRAGDDLTQDSGADITADGTLNVVLTVGDYITLNDDVDTGGGYFLSTATGTDGTFLLYGTVDTGDGFLMSRADVMILPGTLDAGSGVVALNPVTSGRVSTVGTHVDGTFAVDSDELSRITAGVLRLGNWTTGAFTLTGAIDPPGTNTLALVSGATITQSSGATVTIQNLRITSVGSVTLLESNDVQTLSAEVTGSGATFGFNNAGGLTIGDVDYTQGLLTRNGTITVSTEAGDLDLDEEVDAGSATINLTADDSIDDDNDTSTKIRSTGTINLTATNGDIGSASVPVDVAAGYSALNTSAAGGVWTR